MVVTTTRKNCGFARHSTFMAPAKTRPRLDGVGAWNDTIGVAPETELMGSPITFDKLRNLFFPL
jgi:hypothetical protein